MRCNRWGDIWWVYEVGVLGLLWFWTSMGLGSNNAVESSGCHSAVSLTKSRIHAFAQMPLRPCLFDVDESTTHSELPRRNAASTFFILLSSYLKPRNSHQTLPHTRCPCMWKSMQKRFFPVCLTRRIGNSMLNNLRDCSCLFTDWSCNLMSIITLAESNEDRRRTDQQSVPHKHSANNCALQLHRSVSAFWRGFARDALAASLATSIVAKPAKIKCVHYSK